jgi:hypothetical protein
MPHHRNSAVFDIDQSKLREWNYTRYFSVVGSTTLGSCGKHWFTTIVGMVLSASSMLGADDGVVPVVETFHGPSPYP